MKEQNSRLLEQFFDGSISKNEKIELQKRLVEDAELAAEFDFQSKIGQAFQSAEHRRMKQILQAEESRLRNPMQVGWLNPRRLMAAAAVLLGLAVFFWTRDRPAERLDPEALFAQNFQVFNPSNDIFLQKSGVRGGEASGVPEPADAKFRTEMQAALTHYEAKKFAAAAQIFEKIQTDNLTAAASARFYLGICQNADRNFAEAEKSLTSAAAMPGNYQAPALWQLALAQLGQGKTTDAKISFEKYLAAPDGIPERKRAQTILKNLK